MLGISGEATRFGKKTDEQRKVSVKNCRDKVGIALCFSIF